MSYLERFMADVECSVTPYHAVETIKNKFLSADFVELKESETWIIPDNERFHDEPRNLTMDCSLIKEHGIHFCDSVEGIHEAILRPFRTK